MSSLVGDVGIALECAYNEHQKTRRAEATLQRVVLDKCRLQHVKAIVLGKVFHRPDLAVRGLVREHQARTDRRAVDKNRTGAANTVLATDMRAGKTAILPNRIGQRLAMLHLDVMHGSVHAKFQGDSFHRRLLNFGPRDWRWRLCKARRMTTGVRLRR